MENHKCNATLQDPIYKGSKCDNPAKWKVKLNNETEYIHPRCGTHSKKLDRFPIKENGNKPSRRRNKNEEHQDEDDEIKILGFKFEDLLKYLESDVIKKDIPKDVIELYKAFDNINNYLNILNN